MSSKATCATCPYFSRDDDKPHVEETMTTGTCRIYPPEGIGGWPPTSEHYWCGSHPDRVPVIGPGFTYIPPRRR